MLIDALSTLPLYNLACSDEFFLLSEEGRFLIRQYGSEHRIPDAEGVKTRKFSGVKEDRRV